MAKGKWTKDSSLEQARGAGRKSTSLFNDKGLKAGTANGAAQQDDGCDVGAITTPALCEQACDMSALRAGAALSPPCRTRRVGTGMRRQDQSRATSFSHPATGRSYLPCRFMRFACLLVKRDHSMRKKFCVPYIVMLDDVNMFRIQYSSAKGPIA
ncbi:hypothetical protein C0Q70_12733 [Pomacea canaliculata]|uniref:Uncharacterized protein n=1 Tax=Pomacea canaliculata TaxID=400727 RepID=A0A2T7P2C9_POMCA|nr:hypothetical protein C0Q70_12733 [Pomacea canaliculata]